MRVPMVTIVTTPAARARATTAIQLAVFFLVVVEMAVAIDEHHDGAGAPRARLDVAREDDLRSRQSAFRAPACGHASAAKLRSASATAR